MEDVVDIFGLDHLGLPAQMADEIRLVDALDALLGVDTREVVTSGQAVLAMALNCLGFTSRPLYITPKFFEPRNLKFLVGGPRNRADVELGLEHFNEHKLGRTLDRIAKLESAFVSCGELDLMPKCFVGDSKLYSQNSKVSIVTLLFGRLPRKIVPSLP